MVIRTLALIFIFLVLHEVYSGTMIPHIGFKHPRPLPKYKIQLNDDPIHRWDHIIPNFKKDIQKVVKLFKLLPIPKGLFQFINAFSQSYEQKYPEFVQEIKGIAKLVDEPFDMIFFLNFFYEISSYKACSTIIARNSQNQILHSRNLDYFLWGHFSRLQADVDVYRGDQLQYTMQMIIGSVFTTTGQKPGKFMINEDTRKNHEGIYNIITGAFIKQYIPAAYLIRKVLEEENTYEDALKRLKYDKISTTVYYMISGTEPNQGAVIERYSEGIHEMKELDANTWYLVKTNYDYDQKEPWDDHRQEYAHKYMKKVGQGLTIKQLQDDVMSKWPLYNIGTILTVSSITKDSYHNSIAWYKVHSQAEANGESEDSNDD